MIISPTALFGGGGGALAPVEEPTPTIIHLHLLNRTLYLLPNINILLCTHGLIVADRFKIPQSHLC